MLTLSILRSPEGVPPEMRQVAGGEFIIGRGSECDWALPDPERVLSKRHCLIAFDGDGWHVTDTSTNGSFLNHLSDRLDTDVPRPLRNGDRLIFGAYEIEIVIDRAAPWPVEPDGKGDASPVSDDRLTSDPFPPMDGDPLGAALPSAEPVEGPWLDGWLANRSLAEGDVASDHAPVIQESFRPPRSSLDLLPDDWDADDAAPPYESLPNEPSDDRPESLVAAAPAMALQAAGPADQRDVLADGLAAFIEGAGVQGMALGDPLETLRGLGAAFRAVVTGLRRMMIARAAIKGEFRIEQTMIRPAGNNPLKFSADDEDALAGLLGVGRRSEMTAKDAVADALHDMRLHELAMMSAMQQAVYHLLEELAPAGVLHAMGREALDVLPGRRKMRGWVAYEALHTDIVQALADDFDSVFGKSFARAYERAMAEIVGQAGDVPV